MSILNSFINFAEGSSDILITRKRVEEEIVFFDKGPLHLCFQAENKDPNYFRMLLPIDGEEEKGNLDSLYKRYVEISTGVKVGKVIIVQNKVWLSVELFTYDSNSDSDMAQLFRRMIGVLEYMFNEYKKKDGTTEQ